LIAKCKRLKNIGKFYDFSGQANDLEWHKNTLVFAPNAYGKATVVDVLRPFATMNPS
jgi:wobble nucleotide-excising tRNase